MDKPSVTRFYLANVTAYLATIIGIALAAFGTGWFMGRKCRGRNEKLSPVMAAVLIGLGAAWFVAAQLARNHADTDKFGSEFAEWFAHAGKWFVLLFAVVFGHGRIFGASQTPAGKVRRIFYFVAVLGIITLIIARTMPIYFLLDAGARDDQGCLRESEKFEVTCGAVALLNYLERYAHHAPLTEREVSQACGVTAEGTTTTVLVRAAKSFGLTNATARMLTLEELEKSPLPVIVSISTLPTVHHATLLIELEGGRAYFIDPAYGFRDLSVQRFQEIWYGKTVLLK
jgi:hypothetical protein